MTTPEAPAGGATAGPASKASGRVQKPKVERVGPQRANGPARGSSGERTISDAVAHAVKEGYDVIAQNIHQGRLAAERFREGNYPIGAVPGDLETAALRMLNLARELSATTFDIAERLVKGIAATASTGDRTAAVPAFRQTGTPPAATGYQAAPATAPSATGYRAAPATAATASGVAAGGPSVMPLSTRFTGDGAAKAQSRTEFLKPPRTPTQPKDISATALSPRSGAGSAIAQVSFEAADIALGGLVAIVTVPGGQAAGTYTGLVFAGDDEAPLGALSIEIVA
ncbi:MAG TPA: hypothetical protein VGS12_10980 [Caulobacteraceae bacterium]|nr:hypothetical protein [Caulobacteraceae bacterium]